MKRGRRIGLLAAILSLTACGLMPTATPQPTLDADAVARFSFIRDDMSLFPPGQRRRAEGQLRDIARRSGVLGVVITAPSADLIDPPRDYRPIIAEAQAMGAEALIALCVPNACSLDTASAYSDSLADAVGQVAPVPEPAPGQGLPINPGFELRRWVEFVGAVATLPP